MKKFRVWLHTGYAGQLIEDEIEISDDATPEDIEEQCKDVAFQSIDWGYEELKDDALGGWVPGGGEVD